MTHEDNEHPYRYTNRKKLQGYHTTKCKGYEIIAMEAKSKLQGGAALFYWKSKYYVKGTRSFGPNVVRTTLLSGKQR
jgi:hypothetical protein